VSLPGCRIIDMTSGDLDAAARLDRGNPSAYSREQLAAELARPGGFRFVARDQAGTVTGYLCGSQVLDEAEIFRITVAPESRRHGIGRALLQHALANLAGLQVHHVYLEVRPSNAAARSLYAAAGFVECGRRPGYYADPLEDAILMCRKI